MTKIEWPKQIWLGHDSGFELDLKVFIEEDWAGAWAAADRHRRRVVGPVAVPPLPVLVGRLIPATVVLEIEKAVDDRDWDERSKVQTAHPSTAP